MGGVYGIRSTRVVLPSGVQPATVYVRGTRIDRVVPEPAAAAATADTPVSQIRDVGDHVVMPGIVDTHVHVNEPGRTEWEGFDTATRAAAAGGITTIVDMPLNSVPATTKLWALDAKQYAARDAHVEVLFWGGVVPGNAADLELLADAGVPGLQVFSVPVRRRRVRVRGGGRSAAGAADPPAAAAARCSRTRSGPRR